MSDAILGAILSAVIAGVFGLISKRMELSHTSKVVATSDGPISMPMPIPQPTTGVNYGTVLKHIGILQFVLNIFGFLLGLSMGSTGASMDTIIVAGLFLGTILLSIGFVWSALKVDRAVRWKHLFAVAIGVIITTLVINSIVLQTPISGLAVFVAILQSLISMGIGGLIANRLK